MPHVALFATCLVDLVLPEVGIASVKLLERIGVEIVFPPEQTCCGQPFFNSGFRTEAARLAKKTIEVFETFETIILPSGSCTTMIRHEYPALLAAEPEWAARAAALAAKTLELSEFLARSPDGAALASLATRPAPGTRHRAPVNKSLTYHDSCHMCRTLGIRETPRRALEQAGAEITEMAESDRCCGFGGLFSLHMPAVSASMTAEKLRLAAATGAEVLATADPGCLMHMRRFAAEGMPRIEHLAVVLEELTR